MNHVTKEDKNRWGSYSDRKNSFDDGEDIYRFADLVNEQKPLREYLRSYIGEGDCGWVEKPDGDYGVDLALYKDNVRVANFDLERWSQWKEEWPSFYKHLTFLGRKEKFLHQEVPFFMCWMSFNRDRVLVVDEQTILCYPTIDKHFRNHDVIDKIKNIPMKKGYIFGNYTRIEKNLFKTMK